MLLEGMRDQSFKQLGREQLEAMRHHIRRQGISAQGSGAAPFPSLIRIFRPSSSRSAPSDGRRLTVELLRNNLHQPLWSLWSTDVGSPPTAACGVSVVQYAATLLELKDSAVMPDNQFDMLVRFLGDHILPQARTALVQRVGT